MASGEGVAERPRQSRAAKACRRCNSRRIKCDALQHGTPCTHCRETPDAQCTLNESRRGLKVRQRARVDSHIERFDSGTNVHHIPGHQDQLVVDGSDSIANGVVTSTDDPTEPSLPKAADMDHGLMPSNESSELVASQSTDREDGDNEISWSAMFDHFLESRTHDRRDVIDKCAITYLGESFPLALVMQDMLLDGSPRLHHPGLRDEEPSSRSARILPEDLQFLEAKKAFKYPDKAIMDALVSVFIERYSPLYPVVNLQEFLAQHESNSVLSSFLDAWGGADFGANGDETGMASDLGSINIPQMS